MKKIAVCFLCLLMLFPLISCSTLEPDIPTVTQEETEKPNEEKKTDYPKVSEPLTWERINAIPTANATMTTDELRKICTDYFRLQLTFQWTPAKSFTYTIASQGRDVDIKQGTVYAGNLYVTSGVSNLYRFMQHYDPETGIFEVKSTGDNVALMGGNQCSYGSFWGWARVSNSFSYTLTHTITPKNGAIPVGPYKSTEEKTFTSTKAICQENGEQVMYESYALLQPADGIVHYDNAGHVQMVSQKAHVVRNADGTINGKESYILYLDQGSSFEKTGNLGETAVYVQGGVDEKSTFSQMYKSGYIPFTLKELIGEDPVEAGEVSFDMDVSAGPVSIKDLANGKVSANYTISDITVTLSDKDGQEIYSYIGSTGALHCDEFSLKNVLFPSSIKNAAGDEDVTLRIRCRLGTGENFTIYEDKAVF